MSAATYHDDLKCWQAPGQTVYRVTKLHTAGILTGLTTTEHTTTKIADCVHAIGGGAYKVLACVPVR